jgi:hypothetical protein
MPELNTPEVNVNGTIRAAQDSEELVRRLVSEGVHSEEVHETIQRNADHLSLTLERAEIKESKSPALVGLQEALDLGVKFIEAAE